MSRCFTRPANAAGLLLIAVAVVLYGLAYHRDPAVPVQAAFDSGWWSNTDQGRYYRAALAWARGDLRPSQHWYLPLYPLLGAAFVWLSPAQPFLWPDLGSFIATGLLTMALARRLAPDFRLAPLWGAAAFCLADASFHTQDISARYAIKSWIEPWTTTPVAPLMLGLLLATLRLRDAPGPARAALCGAIWGLVLMARPTEAMWSSLPAIGLCAVAVLRAPQPRRARARIVACGIGAALTLAALTLELHLAIWGWSWGDYLRESLGTGFEPRLLALRWNMLVLDSRPLHQRVHGLAAVFVWVLPGFAGLIACALAARGQRTAHLVVAGSVMLHWAVYLCYRDLHPEGLWWFGNYHYFKWTQPLLCVYAGLLVLRLARRRERRAALAAIAVVLLSCCWQSRLVRDPQAPVVRVAGPRRLVIPGGLTDPREVLVIPARGDAMAIYLGPQHLDQHGRDWSSNGDVKAWKLSDGMVLEVLRSLPPSDAVVELAPGITLTQGAQPGFARMRLVFGLPCAILPWRASCRPVLP